MHAQWSSQGCACAESVCVTRLQCASSALASRHNPWDTLTHAIASISPGLDAPSFQIDRNDWPVSGVIVIIFLYLIGHSSLVDIVHIIGMK